MINVIIVARKTCMICCVAGTRVTPEAFLAWKKKFDAEMRAVEENEKWVRIFFFLSFTLSILHYFF